MRILHVINTLRTGGAEHLMVNLLPKIRSEKDVVELCVFNGERTTFMEQLESAGIKIHVLGMGNVYNPLLTLKLRELMRNYDIVHTHNTSPQFFAALGKCKTVKLVTTEHSTSNRRRGNLLFKVLDRFMYAKYERIICISDKTEALLAQYIPAVKNRLVTIYNGVDIEKYSSAKKLEGVGGSSNHFVITMVAGFRYQKDHITAIRAMSHLDSSKFVLWFVGDGEKREVIETEIKRLNLDKSVKLWGVRSDIPNILKASDVILQCSHIEGFGLAAVEGMAAGKPVIATNIPGLSQVVGGWGILVPHENASAIAIAVEKLQADTNYYNHIAEKCAKGAKQYCINTMADQYIAEYHRITDKE